MEGKRRFRYARQTEMSRIPLSLSDTFIAYQACAEQNPSYFPRFGHNIFYDTTFERVFLFSERIYKQRGNDSVNAYKVQLALEKKYCTKRLSIVLIEL